MQEVPSCGPRTPRPRGAAAPGGGGIGFVVAEFAKEPFRRAQHAVADVVLEFGKSLSEERDQLAALDVEKILHLLTLNDGNA